MCACIRIVCVFFSALAIAWRTEGQLSVNCFSQYVIRYGLQQTHHITAEQLNCCRSFICLCLFYVLPNVCLRAVNGEYEAVSFAAACILNNNHLLYTINFFSFDTPGGKNEHNYLSWLITCDALLKAHELF